MATCESSLTGQRGRREESNVDAAIDANCSPKLGKDKNSRKRRKKAPSTQRRNGNRLKYFLSTKKIQQNTQNDEEDVEAWKSAEKSTKRNCANRKYFDFVWDDVITSQFKISSHVRVSRLFVIIMEAYTTVHYEDYPSLIEPTAKDLKKMFKLRTKEIRRAIYRYYIGHEPDRRYLEDHIKPCCLSRKINGTVSKWAANLIFGSHRDDVYICEKCKVMSIFISDCWVKWPKSVIQW